MGLGREKTRRLRGFSGCKKFSQHWKSGLTPDIIPRHLVYGKVVWRATASLGLLPMLFPL
jgi:hypothetical protein